MEILDKKTYCNIKNSILTIGNFDGVHVGHVEIIKFLNKDITNINI